MGRLAALLVVVTLASGCSLSFPYTSKERKCADVYGYGQSAGIHDADDCLSRDRELRPDGQFKDPAEHCRILGRHFAAKDARCKAHARVEQVVDPARLGDCLSEQGDDALSVQGVGDQPDERLGSFGYNDGRGPLMVVLPTAADAEAFARFFPVKDVVAGWHARRFGNVFIREHKSSHEFRAPPARVAATARCLKSSRVARTQQGESSYRTCSKIDGGTGAGLLVAGVSCERGRDMASGGPADAEAKEYGTLLEGICCSLGVMFLTDGEKRVLRHYG